MKGLIKIYSVCFFILMLSVQAGAQEKNAADSTADSSQQVTEKYLIQQREQQRIDSMIGVQLQKELGQVDTDSKRKKELEDKLEALADKDSIRKAEQLKKISELKQKAVGYPVVLFADTLFYIYTRFGSFSALERAQAISERIKKLYSNAFFDADSLKIIQNEITYDIVYNNDNIIMSVPELDGLWFNEPADVLANNYLDKIKKEIVEVREDNSLVNWLKRIGFVCMIFLGTLIIVFGTNRLFNYTARLLGRNKEKHFKGITIRKIKVLSPEHHYRFAIRFNNFLRLVIVVLSLYIALPLLFGLFPQTQPFANTLWNWITTPAKAIFNSIIDFLPNLVTIIIIFIVTRYFIKIVKYFASEVEKGAINIHGFYSEWALPTFNILRVLIYAFMFIIIFPYLPGSQSDVFKGVTVFLGILVSLGSSSAISNIIAGLVITYMRPFKNGDRVKIGEVVGDVLEKTLLITRIKTIKNEEITIPNSTILNNHTINYSTNSIDEGLIIHTTVTIGYGVPWKDMHQALIDAACKTEFILKQPTAFVLQTSLDDFYVSYQVNAYTKAANRQAQIYSDLHQNIQDVCKERGIEIMSPHYNALRDGNMTTIPQNNSTSGAKKSEQKKSINEDEAKN